MLGLPSVAALAETFKVLGDVTRVRILDALSRSELCVCDIAQLIGLSESAVSHQLRLLRGMRLVRARRDGRMVFYTLDDQHIVRLFEQGMEHVEERPVTNHGQLRRLRAARRVDLQDRGDGLPRRGRDDRAAVQEPARPRRLLGRPGGPAAAREVRRDEGVGVGDCCGRRRCRLARVAGARGTDRRRRTGGEGTSRPAGDFRGSSRPRTSGRCSRRGNPAGAQSCSACRLPWASRRPCGVHGTRCACDRSTSTF